ncbi:MAG: helix-turn-helix transcriptional regulator [Clostridia bacterium]|nr:helix-turn-helix transcriptional regulator [Clostridia bacterium]
MTASMFEALSNIQITGIIRGNSTAQATIDCRPSHTLIYKINGESIYYLRGTPTHLREGTVLYVPEGEKYSFEKVSAGESLYCLINFHCTSVSEQKPQLFSSCDSEHVHYIFNQMLRRWLLAHNSSDRYELLSLFYHLISILLQTQEKQYHTSAQYARLRPALSYLEEHLYDPDLTCSTLAALCGVSEVTFRGLFADQFGEPPKKYIIRCRLTKAKTVIESGEYSTLNEVAYTVGYQDPLYFSRHFKKYFGMPPSLV